MGSSDEWNRSPNVLEELLEYVTGSSMKSAYAVVVHSRFRYVKNN